jgi:DNA-binding beta-propeller fold protein YncE
VEWLGGYASQKDLPRPPGEAFLESIIGAAPVRFEKPTGIASDGEGRVYVTDIDGATVLVYDFNLNKVEPFLGEEDAALFQAPRAVEVDGKGNIYISDTMRNRVFAFTRDRKPLFTIGGDEPLEWPVGIAVDDARGRIYVANARGHNIKVFDLDGNYLRTISRGGNRDGYLNFPSDIDLDSKGNLVVADSMNARVQVFTPEGGFIRKFGHRGDSLTDFQLIKGIAVDRRTDNIYVADGRANRFLIFNPEGEALLVVGGAFSAGAGMTAPGGFLLPQGISIDREGKIYVADSLNRRFQVFQIVDEAWLKEHPIER